MPVGQWPVVIKGVNVTLASYRDPWHNTAMPRPFLQAHWSHLCVISYAVPPDLLTPHLPRGLKVDLRDGRAFVSIVAFDFENTRVKGIAWPFYRDFPEVNLRFYVRNGNDERGVCFIREFVPKRLVSWIAKKIYNEPYERIEMKSDVHRKGEGLEVVHKFKHHERWQEIALSATKDAPLLPAEDSLESFLIDQQWGFGRDSIGRPLRYRVAHPRWLLYHVEWAEVKVNWAKTYGPQWKFLDKEKPISKILAEGSEVSVFPATAA